MTLQIQNKQFYIIIIALILGAGVLGWMLKTSKESESALKEDIKKHELQEETDKRNAAELLGRADMFEKQALEYQQKANDALSKVAQNTKYQKLYENSLIHPFKPVSDIQRDSAIKAITGY